MDFEDILYDKADGVATIAINRPEVLNAFRNATVNELCEAFADAWRDRSVGVVIFTGSGDRAFCTGGDQSVRAEGGYGSQSKVDAGIDIEDLHSIMRDIPKPVIGAVNGYAIGGGHVLHVLCDLSIASETARFGQVGPKVGSFDAGFGTGYLAAVVGEKRAREIWFLCRQYTAEEALAMGLVNAVVPAESLMDEAHAWAAEILDKSPTALRILKQSFNVQTESLRAVSNFAMSTLAMFYGSEESMEGSVAFKERRPPNYSRFRSS